MTSQASGLSQLSAATEGQAGMHDSAHSLYGFGQGRRQGTHVSWVSPCPSCPSNPVNAHLFQWPLYPVWQRCRVRSEMPMRAAMLDQAGSCLHSWCSITSEHDSDKTLCKDELRLCQ